MYKVRFFYESDNLIYYINSDDETTLHEQTKQQKTDDNYDNNYHYFEMFDDDKYTGNIDGLINFKNDMIKWNDECKSMFVDKNNYYISYFAYKNHTHAVLATFNKTSSIKINSLNIPSIKYYEHTYFCKTNNGGLQKLRDKFKCKDVECFGYDYSSYFPTLLAISDFKIGICEGIETKIEELDYENLKYGLYNATITSDDEDFKMLFGFSKKNWYTHYDILFAYEHKTQFKVTIILNTVDEINALIYDKTTDSKVIFKPWYNMLIQQKNKHPNNKIVKSLFSSIIGRLTKYNAKIRTYDEIKDLDYSYDYQTDRKTEHKILDDYYVYRHGIEIRNFVTLSVTQNIYKSDLARMKSFFASYQRCYIADMIINQGLTKNLIRIHTDGIVLDKEYDFENELDTIYYPKPEKKNTGLFHWYHCNYKEKLSSVI